ncbi:hypothetical protein GCM10010244_50740 [Streptomyces coeruleorubidus]|nr:hypothetical protein GCM10010244_50740 [Streptomyces bellus]
MRPDLVKGVVAGIRWACFSDQAHPPRTEGGGPLIPGAVAFVHLFRSFYLLSIFPNGLGSSSSAITAAFQLVSPGWRALRR